MQTPNNEAGKITELIMSKIRNKLAEEELSVHQYNRVYESIYETLIDNNWTLEGSRKMEGNYKWMNYNS